MTCVSSSRSFEASGARARFAAALTAMRLLWLMTSVVSGHPGLEGREAGCSGRPLGAQVRAWGQRAKAGLAGGGGDHAAGHGALGGPGLRGAERRREVRCWETSGSHELTENMRSDPGIFNFVKWLRVGEEACPTLEQAKARLREAEFSINPAPSTGLLHSILRWQQDCSTQSCVDNRIAPLNPAAMASLLRRRHPPWKEAGTFTNRHWGCVPIDGFQLAVKCVHCCLV